VSAQLGQCTGEIICIGWDTFVWALARGHGRAGRFRPCSGASLQSDRSPDVPIADRREPFMRFFVAVG
jgi:hypothetical protein